MTEKDLRDLGFSVYKGDGFYYYVYEFGESGLSLLSNANDEVESHKENGWFVDLFDYDGIRFLDRKDVEDFMNLINKVYDVKQKNRKDFFIW
jgi:hypothetical protein